LAVEFSLPKPIIEAHKLELMLNLEGASGNGVACRKIGSSLC